MPLLLRWYHQNLAKAVVAIGLVAHAVSSAAQRFGWVVQTWISLLMLLNMGIGMTAEYTAMGDLFSIILHTTRVPIVIVVGVIASVYTAYGGLYVSIITDQVQVGARFRGSDASLQHFGTAVAWLLEAPLACMSACFEPALRSWAGLHQEPCYCHARLTCVHRCMGMLSCMQACIQPHGYRATLHAELPALVQSAHCTGLIGVCMGGLPVGGRQHRTHPGDGHLCGSDIPQ